jgi:hypothetical protein
MFDEFQEVRKLAVEIALEEAKKNTKEVGAKNRGERIDVYLRHANALKKDAPPDQVGLGWCGMFIYYCYSQAASRLGKVLPFESKAGNLWSGYHLKTWAKEHPDKIVNTCPILPGDIYVMNSGHIGMVVETVNDYDFVKTVDGNQSGVDSGKNSVRKRTRSFYDMKVLVRI